MFVWKAKILWDGRHKQKGLQAKETILQIRTGQESLVYEIKSNMSNIK